MDDYLRGSCPGTPQGFIRIFRPLASAVPPEGALSWVFDANHSMGLPMPNCTEEAGADFHQQHGRIHQINAGQGL
jgi:hypothetical protein